jgi:hypothetical protein
MKVFRSRSRGFTERPYFTNEEIDSICLSELHATKLLPSSPAPIRIDRFIEKRFKVSPRYEDLADGVLGLTAFGRAGVEAVVVTRALDEEGTKVSERRIRSTLAHEAGHGLLHTHLFALHEGAAPLFGDFSDPAKPRVLCRDIVVSDGKPRSGYDGRWWEFQANSVMGSLLLPRPLVENALEQFFVAQGTMGQKVLDSARRPEASKCLSDIFNTSQTVARLRVERLYPVADREQLNL